MGKHKLAFVAFDSAKQKHAVAIAEDGRDGEIRYLGEIENSPNAVKKLITKLAWNPTQSESPDRTIG